MSSENTHYTRDILSGLSPLVLTTSDDEGGEKHQCVPGSGLLKYDPKDKALNSLLDNNRRWAAAVMKEDPHIFSSIAQKQEPKLLWIGMSYSVQSTVDSCFSNIKVARILEYQQMSF